jgi:hypothetical protein
VTLLVALTLLYQGVAWFPDPSLAFYIARGWLGAYTALLLYRAGVITALGGLVFAAWETSTAVCGSFFVFPLPIAEGLCDRGTGLPVTYPLLALTLVAVTRKNQES